jgi:hypothetical protein
VIGLPNVETADVSKFEAHSFLSHVPRYEYVTRKLYEEGLEQLNKELEEAYAECCLELEDEIDPQLEVYLNNDYYSRREAA